MGAVRKVVVIGADAAGMSAAHQALRSAKSAGETVEVVALEKTRHTSYSACGLPYWVAGDVDKFGELVARGPERHREMGVDLRMGATATVLDVERREVRYRDHDGAEHVLPFDDVVIASGAAPVFPDWMRGADGELFGGVGAVKTPDDGERWIENLTRRFEQSGGRHGSVVVAGGGYIGLEMAEAARRRGYAVTLLTRSRVMSSLDGDMSERIEKVLNDSGVTVVNETVITGLEVDASGWVRSVSDSDGNDHSCDLLVVALGITPATDFVPRGTLPVGRSGGLLAQADGSVVPHVWAGGDCTEVKHRVSGTWTFMPLGTHANKQGRVIGMNLFGEGASFGGVLGTAITRYVHQDINLEISRTGLSTEEARRVGIEVVSMVTEGRTASGYMPESSPIAVKILAEPGTRRLLGAQILGGRGAAKRIDTVAAALWSAQTVDDLAGMDLAYAPPFATVWEAVQLAARRLGDRM